MQKILKKTSSNFIAIQTLHEYLNRLGITLHHTPHTGILYEINNKFYKYCLEGNYTDTLPPDIEGNLIECDSFGHTDYYQNK